MSASGEASNTNVDGKDVPPDAHIETSVAESEATYEDAATSPVAEAVEPPEAFIRLKNHCDTVGLKSTIELETYEAVSIEFKNGRAARTVFITSEDAANALVGSPLNEIVFLGDYSAICSYNGRWIEAAVRAHGTGARRFIARRNIFGINIARSDTPGEVEILSPSGLTLRLTEKPGMLTLLEYAAPFYLRIEGIGITEHDKAVNLLEDLSNSLFMQVDFRFDAPLALTRDKPLARRLQSRTGPLDEDNKLSYPRFSYDRSPSALYWYARSATSMPLLQFLAFYQCIEFYFPQYSRQETIAKIKNILKDPSFDTTNDSDINSILNATLEGRRGSLLEERKQLGATLKQCVNAVELREFLNETEERKQYYTSDYKKISNKKISLTDEINVLEQTVERIYDIRCKVVHTKNLEAGERDEMILPFSEEADLLMGDVELIRFLARKVLIASSVLLKI